MSNESRQTLSRRRMLLAGTTLAAASAMGSTTQTAQAQPAPAPAGGRPNILVIFGDDMGQANISAYYARTGRLQDAEHRPHRQGRHDVHRLLRGEQLHGGPLDLHHRPDAASVPVSRKSASRARRSDCRTATSPSRRRSSRSAMRPDSSARTTLGTATNSCRPRMASTSSSATSITSMPRRSRSARTGRRTPTPNSSRATLRAACCERQPTARSMTPGR